MPAKPRYEKRPLAGAPSVIMHLWSGRAGESVFGVGYADYPAADARVVDATRDALVANIRGNVTEEKPIVQHGLRGRELTAEGGDIVLKARLFTSGPRLYEVVVIGRRRAVKDAAAEIDLFLSSFQPYGAGPERIDKITSARTTA